MLPLRRNMALKFSEEDPVISWLLEKNQPTVRYYTLLNLLNRSNNDAEVKEAHLEIPKNGWARTILEKQKPGGYWESEKSLYRPKYTATNWMAIVLSDFGLKNDNEQIAKTAELFFKYWLALPSGENVFNDEVCIVGNTARFLVRFGYDNDFRVKKLIDRLVEDQRNKGGWDCFSSDKSSLDGWEALAAFASIPKQKRTKKIQATIERGAEFYLQRKLFDDGEKRYAPWFRFHYPTHYYYDVLVGLDMITSLGYAADKRLKPALGILNQKRRKDGTWILDAVHPDPANYAWGRGNLKRKVKPFALEQVGKPSKWITLKALQVMKRVDDASPM
jgi:hypothetical protein